MIKIKEVFHNQIVTINPNEKDAKVLASNLRRDIVIKFIIKDSSKQPLEAGLARAIDINKLENLFIKYNLDQGIAKAYIYVVGGDDSNEAKKYEEDLSQAFSDIDKGRGIFEITWETNEIRHSNFCTLSGNELIQDES